MDDNLWKELLQDDPFHAGGLDSHFFPAELHGDLSSSFYGSPSVHCPLHIPLQFPLHSSQQVNDANRFEVNSEASCFKKYAVPAAAAAASAASAAVASSSSSYPSSYSQKYMWNKTMELHKYFHETSNHKSCSENPRSEAIKQEIARTEARLQSPPPQPDSYADQTASYNHKIAERQRRKMEAQHLTTLKSYIPFLKKKDKVSTLKGCIQLIEQLVSQVKSLEAQVAAASAAKAVTAAAADVSNKSVAEELSNLTEAESSNTKSGAAALC